MNLEFRNITKKFGDKIAINNFSTTLTNGLYGFLGPNGSGKTTLMRQMTTILKPDDGKILYNGENIFKMGEKYRDLIGYLPQDFGVYKNFSAKHFLSYIATLKGMSKIKSKNKIDELLKTVGLEDVKNKAVGKFSGGMRRRVGIAQALLNDPKILVLDEPTAGLDPQERNRLRNLLSQISKDKIVLLSTHIISDIESIAKETLIIKEGSLLKQDSLKNILMDMTGKVYLVKTTNESEVNMLLSNYKVVNIQRGVTETEIRIISEKVPNVNNAISVEPRFEDVYMFYFDLNS